MTRKLTTEQWLACVGAGWHAIVRPLIEKAEVEGAEIVQIKEKFAGLRFYVHGASDELHAMIESAERQSVKTCEDCGVPGKPRPGGWVKTLCDSCAGL